MTDGRPTLGTKLRWWAILLVRLLFTHPLRWQYTRQEWQRDFDKATNPPPW